MDFIKTREEAREAFNSSILNERDSKIMAKELSHVNWVAVGSMVEFGTGWEYSFIKKDEVTMYSKEHSMRRLPTKEEQQIISNINI